ncbi:hypothetical protein [Roseivivax sediminis]|uniref:HdeA/HdeB family protein n=1 Tax=Roseivivax sediminis TaxID=936889 RepID=A0A1I1VBU7_9RHOB|nr:hypothetical protein [Roseivivax sediminis]SFD80265.1 hypothetical protein SAMN04515678_103106 [Roseivivax sediminis]
MTRKTSILALVSAGALTGFGPAAVAQSAGSVTCEEYLLMDERTQGRIALEIVDTPEGIATTTDIPGNVAVGTVEGLVTACELNPERTTAEIAAEIFDDKDGDGVPEMPASGDDGFAGTAEVDSFEDGAAAPTDEDLSEDEAVGDVPEADETSDDGTQAEADADVGDMEAGADGSATDDGTSGEGTGGANSDSETDAGSDGSGSDGSDGSDGGGSDGGDES